MATVRASRTFESEQRERSAEFERFRGLLLGYARGVGTGSEADPGLGASMAELGIDSMAVIALLTGIEDEFGLILPDELISPANLASPLTLWSAIEPLLRGGEPAGA